MPRLALLSLGTALSLSLACADAALDDTAPDPAADGILSSEGAEPDGPAASAPPGSAVGGPAEGEGPGAGGAPPEGPSLGDEGASPDPADEAPADDPESWVRDAQLSNLERAQVELNREALDLGLSLGKRRVRLPFLFRGWRAVLGL